MTAGGGGMRFGVSFGALYAPADEVVRLGAEAEAGGFDALWVPDSQMLYRDPYATLALLARETRRVRLGTLATNPVTRHAAVTANAILTVHELSGERAVLGIATGDSAVRRIGSKPVRVADLEEAVGELRTLMAGAQVAYPGGQFAIRFAHKPAPPIFVVASGPRLLEVAGGVADGVVLNVGRHPRVLRAALDHVLAGARAAGREPRDVEVVSFFFCAIVRDRQTARARLKPSVSWFCQRSPGLCELAGLPLDAAIGRELERFQSDYARYDLVHSDQWAAAMRSAAFLPDAYVDAFGLGGTAADVVEQLQEIQGLGVQSVLIRPPSPEDWRSTVRAFTEGVIPGLR